MTAIEASSSRERVSGETSGSHLLKPRAAARELSGGLRSTNFPAIEAKNRGGSECNHATMVSNVFQSGVAVRKRKN